MHFIAGSSFMKPLLIYRMQSATSSSSQALDCHKLQLTAKCHKREEKNARSLGHSMRWERFQLRWSLEEKKVLECLIFKCQTCIWSSQMLNNEMGWSSLTKWNYCALLTERRSIQPWKWPLRKSPSNDIPNSNKTVGFQKFRAIFHGRCFRSKTRARWLTLPSKNVDTVG